MSYTFRLPEPAFPIDDYSIQLEGTAACFEQHWRCMGELLRVQIVRDRVDRLASHARVDIYAPEARAWAQFCAQPACHLPFMALEALHNDDAMERRMVESSTLLIGHARTLLGHAPAASRAAA